MKVIQMNNILEHIHLWMADPVNNVIEPGSGLRAFDVPLVGFSHGDDDLFNFLKRDIGFDFYWTPEDAFLSAFPGESVSGNELTVIAWILPQTEHTRIGHRKVKEMPSIEWSKARHYGEKVNEKLRMYVVEMFMANGYQACAPVLLAGWTRAKSDRYGFASCWSERHAAYASGLGTFGLSDGLITPAGKAVRVGSIIVRKRYAATCRTYRKHNEWCLFHRNGKCRACIKRCPAGAISEKGHDKHRCREYIRNITALYVEQKQLGFKVNSCGLCQTGVPCEARRPLAGQEDLLVS
jgi:ferredoxin